MVGSSVHSNVECFFSRKVILEQWSNNYNEAAWTHSSLLAFLVYVTWEELLSASGE